MWWWTAHGHTMEGAAHTRGLPARTAMISPSHLPDADSPQRPHHFSTRACPRGAKARPRWHWQLAWPSLRGSCTCMRVCTMPASRCHQPALAVCIRRLSYPATQGLSVRRRCIKRARETREPTAVLTNSVYTLEITPVSSASGGSSRPRVRRSWCPAAPDGRVLRRVGRRRHPSGARRTFCRGPQGRGTNSSCATEPRVTVPAAGPWRGPLPRNTPTFVPSPHPNLADRTFPVGIPPRTGKNGERAGAAGAPSPVRV